MSWSTRLHTSWELLQRSLEVLRSNPRLLLFPLISSACAFVLALFFLAPIAFVVISQIQAHREWHDLAERMNTVFYVYGIVIYLASMLVATFFNVAFYHEIIGAFSGDNVSLGRGLQFAVGKLRSILMWTLLAGTVGLLIRAVEERLGWLGKLVMGLIGTVWSVAAVFAIPVLIRQEDSNPLTVLRGSASTLKRTWGESLVGFIGIQLGGVAFVLAAIFFAVVMLIAAAVLQSPVAIVVLGSVWLLAVIAAAFFIAMAEHVYKCALYIYASEGVVPGPFTAELMNAGWKVKKS